MENVIIIAVLAVIIGFAGCYVYKEKKRGVRCIGCPEGGSCSGCCGCGGEESSCCGCGK